MLLDLTQVQARLEATGFQSSGFQGGERSGTGGHADEQRSSPTTKVAAVAVILRTAGISTEVLVIERAAHEHDPWSGHLAFPGGRVEPLDESLLHTALRETREELGFDLAQYGRLLGPLAQLQAKTPGVGSLIVAPFAFALESMPILEPDPHEVARTFWVPLGPLLRGERDTSIDIARDSQRYTLPGYQVEDRVLWGLSYRMLRTLFSVLEDR
jgi:8-oxo-dGTP pyrophosphatase MutT (NUDIX family)